MNTIFCAQTYIPIRLSPSHQSEQVSQLIYGESAEVVEKQNGWFNIITHFDRYEGWVEEKAVLIIDNPSGNFNLLAGFSRLIKTNNESIWLSTGSVLNPELLTSKDDFIVQVNPELNTEDIIAVSEQFLGTPYLWGGRTLMGIDCSGLVQVTFKAIGKKLPRDASQQVEFGNNVPFLEHSQPGDLAFFDNAEGEISHVGIIKDQGTLIHASGSVRMDKIDQQGIYNTELEQYTHKLRVVKRI